MHVSSSGLQCRELVTPVAFHDKFESLSFIISHRKLSIEFQDNRTYVLFHQYLSEGVEEVGLVN